jgi:hypothetical protein
MKPTLRNMGWLPIAIALAVCTAIYWHGLYGGFVYDDYSFVVSNQGIQVTTTRLGDWIAAMLSFPSGARQGRWLGMLSFAFNYYFTGMDPFAFKLTNLAIHLINGLLLFLALRALFRLRRATAPSNTLRVDLDLNLVAAVIAGLWVVLPINLTAVLYVSQRLEALSNTFVFLGLWWYLEARREYWIHGRRGAGLWISLIVCTALGTAVKESAVLLPLYAACVEFVLPRNPHAPRRDRFVYVLFGVLLVVPLVAGLIWLATWVDGTRTFGRSFDIPNRILTEARVLLDYIYWTLAPNLDALTLYHDDIQPSHGLFDPPATLLSIFGTGALLAAAIWQRRRRPLFALGIFWFFCGHVLTATVIPLMLAFEHRNYFPSVGLLLAATSLVALENRLLRMRAWIASSVLVFAFYSLTTALRAEEWSDSDRLTLSEAAKRPESPSAQFALGHLMVTKLRRPDGTPMTEDGFLVLEDGSHLPGAGTTFEQSMITFRAERHEPIDPSWWTSLIAKLKKRPPSVSDARVLANLNHCFIDGFCGSDIAPLREAYEAALSHGRTPPTVLSAHAEFAWYLLHDQATAEHDIRAATQLVPFDLNARRNLFVLLLATGKIDEARAELDELHRLNKFGIFDNLVEPLEEALRKKQSASTAVPTHG